MVDVLPDADQTQIVELVARFLTEELPVSRLHGPPGGAPPELDRWEEIAALGYLTLALPEACGGGGLSLAEEMLIFRELGRFLISPVALATVVAGHAAALRGDEALCAAIVQGRTRAAPGIVRGDGGVLLLDAEGADLVLIARDDALHLHDIDSLIGVEDASGLDDSVSLKRATLPATARLIVEDAALARRRRLLNAAMQAGIGEQARDMAVRYAGERTQFGKTIGAFQAIKHRCADMALRCEMAFAQLLVAAIAERDDAPGAAFHTAAAAMLATRSAIENATASIQVHGGIGFTAEYDAHLYVKRANLLARLDRDAPARQAALLAQPLPV